MRRSRVLARMPPPRTRRSVTPGRKTPELGLSVPWGTSYLCRLSAGLSGGQFLLRPPKGGLPRGDLARATRQPGKSPAHRWMACQVHRRGADQGLYVAGLVLSRRPAIERHAGVPANQAAEGLVAQVVRVLRPSGLGHPTGQYIPCLARVDKPS